MYAREQEGAKKGWKLLRTSYNVSTASTANSNFADLGECEIQYEKKYKSPHNVSTKYVLVILKLDFHIFLPFLLSSIFRYICPNSGLEASGGVQTWNRVRCKISLLFFSTSSFFIESISVLRYSEYIFMMIISIIREFIHKICIQCLFHTGSERRMRSWSDDDDVEGMECFSLFSSAHFRLSDSVFT